MKNLYEAPYTIPLLGTPIPKRKNPILAAIADERLVFHVNIGYSKKENSICIRNFKAEKYLADFIRDFLNAISEKKYRVTVEIKYPLEGPILISYSILTAYLMKILGEKLGFEVTIDDVIKYSPLLESKDLIDLLPLIMSLRVSSLLDQSLTYRFGEGYVSLPSKAKMKVYIGSFKAPLKYRNVEKLSQLDLIVHTAGTNIIEASRRIRENVELEEYFIIEEALQHIIYKLEEIVDLNMFFRSKCVVFPDINGTFVVCLNKPSHSFKEVSIFIGEHY